jgi:glycine hydroxymethyltransferase
MERLAGWMDQVVQAPADDARLAKIAGEVAELCGHHPAPGIRI